MRWCPYCQKPVNTRFTTGQVVLLIVLLIVCFPTMIIYGCLHTRKCPFCDSKTYKIDLNKVAFEDIEKTNDQNSKIPFNAIWGHIVNNKIKNRSYLLNAIDNSFITKITYRKEYGLMKIDFINGYSMIYRDVYLQNVDINNYKDFVDHIFGKYKIEELIKTKDFDKRTSIKAK